MLWRTITSSESTPVDCRWWILSRVESTTPPGGSGPPGVGAPGGTAGHPTVFNPHLYQAESTARRKSGHYFPGSLWTPWAQSGVSWISPQSRHPSPGIQPAGSEPRLRRRAGVGRPGATCPSLERCVESISGWDRWTRWRGNGILDASGEWHPAKISGGTWLVDKATGTPESATSREID